MPKAKRERRERTDNWELVQQWCRWPEQRLYERIRPIVLYGTTPAERAEEISLPERSLRRSADDLDERSVVILFRPTQAQRGDTHRPLPLPMRQRVDNLKSELLDLTLAELAGICLIQFGQ